ncbi:MAG: hypothetical protein IJX72_04400, partial [Clostridia bacterium]|nr:hypothetical protein [Clostridia bacterium]
VSTAKFGSSYLENFSGIVAGYNTGTIENCTVKDGAMNCNAECSSYNKKFFYWYGGITAWNQGTVKGCHVDLDIRGTANIYNNYDGYIWDGNDLYAYCRLGGISGLNKGLVAECSSNIRAQYTSSAKKLLSRHETWCYVQFGGIIGLNQDVGTITNCETLPDSSITVSSGGTEVRITQTGMCAGFNSGTIENCSAEGSINETGGFNSDCIIGGFVGRNIGKINTCYANTDVTSVSTGGSVHATGGFVGDNSNTIINCYSAGTVSSCGDSGIGGFIGSNHAGGSISKCFTTCNVAASAATNVNYFTGANEDGATTFKCYYGKKNSITVNSSAHIPASTNETVKSESELYSKSFLCDTLSWKTDTWKITGTGLPTLLWE